MLLLCCLLPFFEQLAQHALPRKMAVKFVLLVNKQGQTRLAKYTDQSMTVEERRALEGEIVRRCLARAEKQVPVADQDIQQHQQQTDHQSLPLQCSFIEHRNYKVIYRRYASLFFLVGVDGEEVGLVPGRAP